MANRKPVTEPNVYKQTFDYFETFGPDRLLFASDWPNAAAVNNLPATDAITKDYFEAKGSAAAEKFFWRNSQKPIAG